MSSQTIRLRLVIRRHAVPEVKLVWPCIANDDLTVSKLLALVNEVVPLESADWGLEDYVVELADGNGDSFELLHFQPVGKVLKEDDQVLIRSLSTEDLKRRRLSGRHQISYDGKHLIDGLAFGRPWLRPPRDRPALDLPPRKRARITHEEEEDDDSYADEEVASEQLLLEGSSPTEDREEPDSVRLRARFVDTDQLGEEDEEMDDDTDFQIANDQLAELEVEEDDDSDTSDEDEPDADLADELKLLQEDNALIEQGSEQEELISSPDNNQEAQTAPAPLFDLSMLDKITALRAAFPFTSMSTMQDALRDHDLKETYQILAKTNSPTVSYDEVLEIAFLGAVLNPTQSSKQGPEEDGDEEENEEEEEEVEEPTLRLPGQPEADSKRPLIQEVNDDESPSEAPTYAKAKPLRRIPGPCTDPFPTSESESDGESYEAPTQTKAKSLISVVDEDNDTSSSSSSSDSDSDSDSESDDESHNRPKEDSDSDSDSDSSDDDSDDDSDDGLDDQPKDVSSSDSSDSDSDSDVAPRLVKVAKATEISGAQGSDSSSSDSSSDSDSSSSDSDAESEPEELSSKKAAEVKQSRAVGAPEVKTQDTKPPGAGLAKTKKRNARRRDLKRLRAMQALEDTQSQPSTNGAPSEDAEFLARKRALLSVVSDESEDVPSLPKETTVTGPSPMIVEVETGETPAPVTTQDAAPAEDSPQRRHKVDMGAGRRMLFGALGLKNPKSKAEEDKLRKSLMKDVKPLQNPRVQTEEAKANGVEPTAEPEEEDPEAWRKVISYRAVECCQEGIVLSEPPFPFVQRWDPQQQYSSMRKRKRASQNFDDSYYGEDSQWNGDEEWQEEGTQQKKKKKSKKRKGKGGYDGGHDEMEITEDSYAETGANGDNDEDIVLNYDDIPKPRLQDTQFTEMDDLPTLPSDLSTLPSLEVSDAEPGMVITWKQLLMSKATKWQPEMVSMTGLVLSIDKDNCLHVLLAKRDRDEDDKEYDEHTGQRVYAKFEVPDLDEDDDGEEDNGRREIAWEEMSEPRLVQPAPSDDSSETLAKGKELPKEHAKPAQDDSMANNKVSAPTHPDETMAEELDTQKVRAEVEADLKNREAATADKPSGTDKSISIPSGQQPPRLEFMGSGDNSPISSFVRPMEGLSDLTNSPSRQLRETIEEVSLTKALEDFIENNVEEMMKDEADGAKDAKDLDEPMPTAEAGWDAIVPDSLPSPDLPPLPKKDDVPVDHRLLVVPSSAGSVRSGRQPPSVSGLEDLPEERIEDSVVDNRPHKRTPSPQISAISVRSSSPFPSLEEMFATARQTQSPAKFSQPSVPRFLKTEKRDDEYEEAMRKLDEGEDDSDRSHDRNKSLRSLFKHATQEKSPLQQSIKSEVVEAERIAAPSSQKIKEESQFMVPDGSQVIELSSSSSPPYVEHYAEDKEDETYDDSPLPQGEGWVQKNYSEVKTRSRGKSLPATAAKEVKNKTVNTTEKAPTARGRTSLPPASAFSHIRGRRKATRKF